jgi:hypothetical protein
MEEVSLGMEVDMASSMLGKETPWNFGDANSVSAVLRTGVVSIGLTE